MPSRIAALASLLLLLHSATAAIPKRQNSNSCPNGWENYINNNDAKCCPGAIYNTDDNTNNEDSAYCCVGATFSVARPSFSSCYPFCSTTGTDSGNGVTVLQTSKQPCSATVFLTDSAYSSKVSAASASISGSSGAGTTTGSSSGTTGSSSSTTGSSSSSHAGAAAMVTSGPLAGALMVAGGLLLV